MLGIEVLREVKRPIKPAVFEDVTQSDLVGRYWRFDGTCSLYLEVRCTAMNTAHTLVLTQKQETIQWLGNSVGIKKVKLIPADAIKPFRSCWGLYLLTANLGIRWRWAFDFRPRPLYVPGENPGTHWTEGWVSPRVGPDVSQKRQLCWTSLDSNSGSSSP